MLLPLLCSFQVCIAKVPNRLLSLKMIPKPLNARLIQSCSERRKRFSYSHFLFFNDPNNCLGNNIRGKNLQRTEKTKKNPGNRWRLPKIAVGQACWVPYPEPEPEPERAPLGWNVPNVMHRGGCYCAFHWDWGTLRRKRHGPENAAADWSGWDPSLGRWGRSAITLWCDYDDDQQVAGGWCLWAVINLHK